MVDVIGGSTVARDVMPSLANCSCYSLGQVILLLTNNVIFISHHLSMRKSKEIEDSESTVKC